MSRYGLYRDSIESAVADRGRGAERLAQIIEVLHGRHGIELAQIAMEVIEGGFEGPMPGRPTGATRSFARLCRAHDNAAALRAVLGAGPPAWHRLRSAGQRPWLEHLCKWRNARGDGQASLYSIAVQPVSRSSRSFLEIAFEVDPTHPWVVGPADDGPRSMFTSTVGTLHYDLLWKALSGEGADMQEATTLARQLKPQYPPLPEDAEERLAAALDCLAFMRSVKAPCSAFPRQGAPLDAAPFALAYGLGRRLDVVKPLLVTYVQAGLLDVDRTLSRHHGDVGGASAVEAAIWARNGAAAVALIELGAQVDFELPESPDEATAPVVAQVREALMRRRLGEAVATGSAASPAPRRRLGL